MGITKAPTTGYDLSITSGGSVNTKGAWGELHSSTPEAIAAVVVSVDNVQGATQKALYDFGTGAGGAEVVQIANVIFASTSNFNVLGCSFYVPLAIPASTRVAMRVQNSVASQTGEGAIELIGGIGTAVVTTYGAVTGSSRGTQIDPGGTPNNFGAWVQLTASCTSPIEWLALALHGNGNAAPTGALYGCSIGTGAGGAEAEVLPNYYFSANAAADTFAPNSCSVPLSIPVSTRIAARGKATTADATDRLFDVAIYCADKAYPSGGGEHTSAG